MRFSQTCLKLSLLPTGRTAPTPCLNHTRILHLLKSQVLGSWGAVDDPHGTGRQPLETRLGTPGCMSGGLRSPCMAAHRLAMQFTAALTLSGAAHVTRIGTTQKLKVKTAQTLKSRIPKTPTLLSPASMGCANLAHTAGTR